MDYSSALLRGALPGALQELFRAPNVDPVQQLIGPIGDVVESLAAIVVIDVVVRQNGD